MTRDESGVDPGTGEPLIPLPPGVICRRNPLVGVEYVYVGEDSYGGPIEQHPVDNNAIRRFVWAQCTPAVYRVAPPPPPIPRFTVGQLRALLGGLDDDLPVVVDADLGCDYLGEVHIATVLWHKRDPGDDGEHDFPYGHEYANEADWPDRGDALFIGSPSGGAHSPRVVLYRARQ